MSVGAIFDPLFVVPFVNGLLLALLLPVLGAYARLRDEWLASLGVAQTAAAGVVVGSVFSGGVTLVALAAAALAAATKALLGRGGNDLYGVMILLGWALALLVAANTAHGDDLARALIQGQLYFTDHPHLHGLLAVGLAVGLLQPWVSSRLLLGRFFPDHFRANGIARPHHDLVFDVLLAVTLALAATTIGVMGAFALVFIPPWVTFRLARGWHRTVTWSVVLGLGAYGVSFAAAIVFDQPYGPVLVVTLLATAFLRLLPRR
ncbi:MAG: metal ABC transporter permease [Vicinamibacterales bacterium]|jgi:zinc transport system permease protein|nr:metal ABC transporter permease [Vicinamibacterales bacterium]